MDGRSLELPLPAGRLCGAGTGSLLSQEGRNLLLQEDTFFLLRIPLHLVALPRKLRNSIISMKLLHPSIGFMN